VIPVKASSHAKTRLALPTPDPSLHGQLVRAIQLDTIEAALSSRGRGLHPVRRVWVVGQAPSGLDDVHPIEDPGGGLNAAVTQAARSIAARPDTAKDTAVAVLVADLPCLVAQDLIATLEAAASHDRAFVRDWHGTGTTLLTAHLHTALAPEFGPDSARRHGRSGAVELAAPLTVRADVDTQADLVRGAEVGLGTHTSAFVRTHSVSCA